MLYLGVSGRDKTLSQSQTKYTHSTSSVSSRGWKKLVVLSNKRKTKDVLMREDSLSVKKTHLHLSDEDSMSMAETAGQSRRAQ